MASVAQWAEQLESIEPSQWPAFLDEHSGLPGPRANLALVDAVAGSATMATIDALIADGGEYQVLCAAAALGRRAADSACASRARGLAGEDRWRVREGVAIGLQLAGDVAPGVVVSVALEWADDLNPLVQRAAVAAICEPRLLKTPDMAAIAIQVCQKATDRLVARPAESRREPSVRTLRQGLGYGWSVAVAADPEPGLAAFRQLDTSDTDVAWIVNQNLRKKRLSQLL